MLLDSLRKFFGLRPQSRPFRKAQPLQKRRAPRLGVELLEDRVVPATVVTNLPDYMPGDTAIITASGFTKGSVVEFQVVHDPSTPGILGGKGHEPWYVRD